MSEVRLEHEWIGKVLLKVTLRLDDRLLHVDRMNPTSAQARARFLKTAKEKEPALNDEMLDAVLMDVAQQGPEGSQNGDGLPGSPLNIEPPVASQEPVQGHLLLDEIRDLLARYVVLHHHAHEAVALWTLFTYVFEAFECSPRLLISSSEPRCGKTIRIFSGWSTPPTTCTSLL